MDALVDFADRALQYAGTRIVWTLLQLMVWGIVIGLPASALYALWRYLRP
jgi:hypothetical protein